MGEPRQWTLHACPICSAIRTPPSPGVYCEGISNFRPTHEPQFFAPVPVVEAVLTDELVEQFARVMVERIPEVSWASISDVGRAMWRHSARAALLAAGFQEPGGTDGH